MADRVRETQTNIRRGKLRLKLATEAQLESENGAEVWVNVPENLNSQQESCPGKGSVESEALEEEHVSSDDSIADFQNGSTSTEEGTSPDNAEEMRRRKRKANPLTWQKEIAKRCRNSGQAYTSSSKSKKVYAAKTLGPPCGEKCRLKCGEKISQEDRQRIFADYWNLADLQRQRCFLLSSMENVMPKYRYVKDGSHRSTNNAFYFSVGGQKHRVCKQIFKSTLAITDRSIRTVLQKRIISCDNIIDRDFRGKHDRHYRVDQEVKDGIRGHIRTRIENHNRRKDSSAEFIEGSNTVAELHRDYVKTCKEKKKPHGNYLMYSRIFKNEFNISFSSPKKKKNKVRNKTRLTAKRNFI